MSARGALIALSGVDCAGKTTQREALRRALTAWGSPPLVLWTRAGYTPGLEALKRLARRLVLCRPRRARTGVSREPARYPRRAADLRHPLKRRLWLTAALLDLLWIYGVRLRVARWLGRTVVCDRYLLDCLVDLRVNFPDDGVERRALTRLLRRLSVRPDAAFCLWLPPEVSLERARTKQRFHWETPEVLGERARAYRALAPELAVQVLDARQAPEALTRALLGTLLPVLPLRELELRGSA